MYNYQAFYERHTTAFEHCEGTYLMIDLINIVRELLQSFSYAERMNAINKWCERFNLTADMFVDETRKSKAEKLSGNEKLINYLRTYDIRKNETSGELLITKDGKNFTEDELQVYCKQNKHVITDLQKILNPENKHITVVQVFNPLKEMSEQYASDYKGEDEVMKLARGITAYNFGCESKTEFYQQRLYYLLHKWGCRMAGKFLGFDINEELFLWLSPEGGSGKSRVNMWMFSLPEFKTYTHQVKGVSNYTPLSLLTTTKAIIDFDELPLSGKASQIDEFKSAIGGESAPIYDKKTKTFKTTPKQASFIGSSNRANRMNKPGIFDKYDHSFMRRFAIVETIDKYRWQEYTKIDLKQLHGQFAHDIIEAQKTGNRHITDWSIDYDALVKFNERYVTDQSYINQQGNSIFDDMIIPCKPKAPGAVVMNATEIINYWKSKNLHVPFTPETLYKNYLKQRHFETGRNSKAGHGYWLRIL